MLQTIRERDDLKGILLVGPIMFWLGLFLLVPLALMVVISFADRGTYGEVVYRFSLDNYRALAAPEYARILWRSIGVASVTTAACLLGASRWRTSSRCRRPGDAGCTFSSSSCRSGPTS